MSGFEAVSDWLWREFQFDKAETSRQMNEFMLAHGRGKVFDKLLQSRGLHSSHMVRKCVAVYRAHEPRLSLPDDTRRTLEWAKKNFPTFLVTDGNKLVQAKKVQALGLDKYFEKVFITHRFGLKAAKPSLYCFSKILDRTGRDWGHLVYVADNPVKDFVGINLQGATTVGVSSSPYFNLRFPNEYLPTKVIENISDLPYAI